MITHLIVALYFKIWLGIFLNYIVHLNLIFLIMQQKSDVKKAASVDTSSLSKKVELASMKSDIDKLKKVPTSLNNLKPDVDKIDLNKVKTTPRERYCQKDLFYRLNSKLFGLGN